MTDVERAEKALRDFHLADKKFRKAKKELIRQLGKADDALVRALKACQKVK